MTAVAILSIVLTLLICLAYVYAAYRGRRHQEQGSEPVQRNSEETGGQR